MLPGLPKSQHQHLTVYEVNADTYAELEQTAVDLREAMTSGVLNMSPTLDIGSAMGIFLLPAGELQETPRVADTSR
jgi:hypothetical protein